MSFEKNAEGIKTMFEDEYNSRMRYSSNIREKKEFKQNYFNKPDNVFDEEEQSESNQNPKGASLWDKITGKNKN
jgi:hypothetical protein